MKFKLPNTDASIDPTLAPQVQSKHLARVV